IYDETNDYNRDYMELKKPRSTAEETRAFIIQDLTDAINSLPAKWASSEYGRATKGAAYALRGKVYLYNQQYDLAAKDFEEIVLDPNGEGYRSEEHTSELQSRENLVCRLLLEKKKKK